jgi:hypothetical protein
MMVVSTVAPRPMICTAQQFDQIKLAIADKVSPDKFQPTLDQCLIFLEEKLAGLNCTSDGLDYALNHFFVSQGIK